MQGTYIPETNYVPREHGVAALLLLLFMVLISSVPLLNLLYFSISTFRSMCAVSNLAVFCNYSTSCFPGILLTYFLNDFEIVPVAFVFTFHMRCISIVRSLYFRNLSASFLITYYYYYYYYHYWSTFSSKSVKRSTSIFLLCDILLAMYEGQSNENCKSLYVYKYKYLTFSFDSTS